MSIKKDINLNLLVIIVVAAGIIILSGVFYSVSVKSMQEEYDKKVEHLQEIEKRLIETEEKINELLESKGLVEKDKESLEKNYLTIQKENEQLKDRITTSFSPFQKTLCKKTGNVECWD